MSDPDDLAPQRRHLRAEVARLREDNARLRQLAGLGPDEPLPPVDLGTTSVELPLAQPERLVDAESALSDRVQLFRSLFRGRDDVHAVRWEDARGRSGYVPAVAGGWRKGQRPRERRYLPLTDEVVRRHLDGEETIGVYPLLDDDRCWWLAADFDGSGWQLDALAYLHAAGHLQLAAYLERSRSGRGGHVWIFFAEPVTATYARRLGSGLVRAAIDRRSELDLDSYDRLFPSQDLQPRGSFGNLIALPLQGAVAAEGNSVFLDPGSMSPVEDQWRYLSQVVRVGPSLLDRALGRLAPLRTGRGAGDRLPRTLRGPERVRVTVDARVRVAKAGLGPELLAAMKHLASVANPEFHKKQRMRLSTWNVARIVRGYDEDLTHLHLPRGVRADLEALLGRAGSVVDVEEAWPLTARIPARLETELTGQQRRAVDDLLEHDLGMLVAPPGAGKTVMACAVIAARQVPTLVLVYRTPLLEQWRQELISNLALLPETVGQLGGGRDDRTGTVDVATFQALARRDDLPELARSYGLVVVDECHHVPAVTIQRVVDELPARYLLGLTATPYRQDGLDALIAMHCGPIRHERINEGAVLPIRLEVHETKLGVSDTEAPIQQILGAVAEDVGRARQVANDVADEVAAGRRCLVLTERKHHLALLADQLRDRGLTPIELHGSLRRAEEVEAMDRLEVSLSGSLVVVATGQYVGEGFDCPPLDTLFVAFPFSYKGKAVQYVGRVMRPFGGKQEVRVHDYLDVAVPVLSRMHDKRRRAFRSLGAATPNDAQPQLDLGG